MDLRNAAQRTMREVATMHHVNTHLAVLYDGAVMYLHREEGYPSVIIKEVVGQRVPAYCTALGKMLLSGLDGAALDQYLKGAALKPLTSYTITDAGRLRGELRTVREQRYAVDNEEFHEGSLCIAAPIYDYRESMLAAASLSVSKPVVAGGQLQRFVDVICDAALRISREMGYAKSTVRNEGKA
jgi:DNA-binding IclR family transcriptional regulator